MTESEKYKLGFSGHHSGEGFPALEYVRLPDTLGLQLNKRTCTLYCHTLFYIKDELEVSLLPMLP